MEQNVIYRLSKNFALRMRKLIYALQTKGKNTILYRMI